MNELIEKYCKLFGVIYENREYLPTSLKERMSKDLIKLYIKDYNTLIMSQEIDEAQSKFELEYKHSCYIPKVGIFRKNKIAKKLLALFGTEFENYLAKLEKSTATVKADTEKTDKDTEQIEKNGSVEETKALNEQQSTALVVKETTEIALPKDDIAE